MILTHEKRLKVHDFPKNTLVPIVNIAQKGDQYKQQMGFNPYFHNAINSQLQGTRPSIP